MKIYKTLYAFTDAELGKIFKCDTIEFEGKFWLVPTWLENIAEGTIKPERIICLDYLPHKRTSSGSPADFILNRPIPKCVFDGEIPAEATFRFDIIEHPDISIDIQEKQNFH